MPVFLRPRQVATNRPVPALNQGRWIMPTHPAHGAIGIKPFWTFPLNSRADTAAMVFDCSADYLFKIRARADALANGIAFQQGDTDLRLQFRDIGSMNYRLNGSIFNFTNVLYSAGVVYDISIESDGAGNVTMTAAETLNPGNFTTQTIGATPQVVLPSAVFTIGALVGGSFGFGGAMVELEFFESAAGARTFYWPMREGSGLTFFEEQVGGNVHDALITPGDGFWTP